ncbi:hypothetical protein [Mucilaginibacter flavidus]|uniref:hypothetical protein n=1 Tax=Mucilaginibacter flavidus TaxID=2949309 RepID=UPI002091EF15|nr:hypothetical protein [Mucilaginibacter flavidus]MCO5945626.1 hypothetical protein [Mucilaginibacter flavidus]
MPGTSSLQIQLTFKNLLVFIFFFFLMHELHELAHIITGRLICGCWGTRDFNVWDIYTDCQRQHPLAILATFAGPIFTFIMLWLGRYWLKYGKSNGVKSFGLILILGNMQFGRMYMAATGSGDEVWGLRTLFLNHDHSNLLIIKIAAFVIVSVICVPPLITAYKFISNKRKILVFIGFLVIPLILDTVVILLLLNGILQKGLLNQVWIMGTPLLVTAWFILCAVMVSINTGCLSRFAKSTVIG